MRPEQIDLDGMLKRLHLPTVRRVYPELAAQAEEEDMGHRDFLAVLIAEEVANRGQTRIRHFVRSTGGTRTLAFLQRSPVLTASETLTIEIVRTSSALFGLAEQSAVLLELELSPTPPWEA